MSGVVGEAPDLRGVTVLIPAAGRVPEGILSLSSIATPAMIPVAGAPVIHWNLQYLTSLRAEHFRVAVPSRGLSVEDYVECVFGTRASFDWVVPLADGGVGSTVRDLLDGVSGPCLVVLGDTLFEFGVGHWPGDAAWLLTGEVDRSERWCVVRCNEGGRVTEWFDKVEGLPGPLEAAAGVYGFADARAAHRTASELMLGGRRLEMSQLLEAVAGAEGAHTYPVREWRDCGNPDTQEVARRKALQERSFNALTFDDRLGTIRKTSTNKGKFIDEINYLRLLPDDVSALFPRVVRASTEWDDPWVEMEYYGYPTLTELYLFERLQPAVWSAVFARLRAVLAVFAERSRPVPVAHLTAMYIDKTRDRLEGCRKQPHLSPLLDYDDLVINGEVVPNLPRLLDDAAAAVAEGASRATGAIVHGDLCFSNVLFDVRTGVCKLIDPRGSFGAVGIHGDQRYDVAKLHHSVVGGYDHMVAGLFDLTVLGPDVALHVHTTGAQDTIADIYRAELLAGWDPTDIELITGLMLASLPGLHSESPQRQVALYVTGTRMVAHALNGAPIR